MSCQIPALIIIHAAMFAVVIFTLMQSAWPPSVTRVVCSPDAEPTSEETLEPEPTTESEYSDIPLSFDLLDARPVLDFDLPEPSLTSEEATPENDPQR